MEKPVKKSSAVNTDQINVKVCPEIKAMWRSLREMDWDVSELARRALKKTFQDALAYEDQQAKN